MVRLILASASPRRFAILRSLGVEPDVRAPGVNEAPLPGEAPSDFVRRLARAKARLAASRGAADSLRSAREDALCLILGADTEVVLDGQAFGKPDGPAGAARMLARLSGRTHEVLTALTLLNLSTGREEEGLSTTRVRFRSLTDPEIQRYIATGEPIDKAGSYAVQGQGARLIEQIDGSFTNVVGLPVELFRELLARHGFNLSDVTSD